ncbi:peptidase [Mycolicibacterium chubuense]|nr:PepSY-associated TM helix domain-containing protein [Mycolicibacterium chubuense]ORA47898.1 peptidase [Mycolicibacterium chubuense]SPY00941.1 peptidase [Mycolicibacterium chubuense]
MTLSDDTVEPLFPAPPTSRTRRRWRPFVVRLHFYAGVLVAPFLLVAAVTGGLYALAPSMERVVYRDILSVEPQGPALPLSDQVARARAVHPDLAVTTVRPAAAPGDTTRVSFHDPALEEDRSLTVFVDPGTGDVLGEEVTWLGYLPLSTWLDGLHRHLNLDEPGRIYSEIAASWLWVVALGGVGLWLGKAAGDRRRGRTARILTVDRSGSGRSRTMNWHGATGIWLLAGLLFLSATGITWSTYAGAHVTEIRSALNWQRPQLVTAPAQSHAGHHGVEGTVTDPAALDYEGVLDAAARRGVRMPVEITAPAEPGATVSVTEIDEPFRWTTNAAAVNPTDLTVTSAVDYWRDYSVIAKLADWGIRAHMGFLFGLLNQLVLLAVAVGLVTVIVRGYRMWWQRRPTRGSNWAVGRPPARGGIRALPPVAIAAVGVTAVAVGWFLPLLGWTLAIFVVVDVIVAAVAGRSVPEEGESP